MFFLFLTKKPIIFFWLIIIYLGIAITQTAVALLVRPWHMLLLQFGFIVCIPFIFCFYRVYRYFCIGYFTILKEPALSFRGISLEVFRTPFLVAISSYLALILINVISAIVFHFERYFFASICLSTLVYEPLFLYATKWMTIYELAKQGLTLSPRDMQGALNEAQQLFLSSFSNTQTETSK